MRFTPETLSAEDFEQCFEAAPPPKDPVDDLKRGRTRRRRWIGIVAAAPIAVAVLALVVGIAVLRPSTLIATPADTSPQDWPIATYQDVNSGSELALLRGRLELIDGCVNVVGPDGHRTVVLFPTPEYRWEDGMLVAPEGRYRVGDMISVGGGSFSADSLSEFPMEYSIPDACNRSDLSFRADYN